MPLDNNYGYAKAYNYYFDTLSIEDDGYILLLNNDTEVDSNILKSFK